jgi:uncharacterized protein YjbI with pentapeptide repeats
VRNERFSGRLDLHDRLKRLLNSESVGTLTKLAEIATKLGVILGIVVWVIEIPDREQQRVDTAWAVVNAATGKSGYAGRGGALQYLNAHGASFVGIDLSNAALPGLDLSNADLRGAIFDGADISDGRFECSLLRHLFGHRCGRIAHARFRDTCFDRTSFKNETIESSEFSDTNLGQTQHCLNRRHILVSFRGALLVDSTFQNIAFSDATFSRSAMFRTKFINVTFDQHLDTDSQPLFAGAELTDVDFSATNLTMNDLNGAKLCRVTMPDGKSHPEPPC